MDKTREYRPAEWYRGEALPDGPVREKVAKIELPTVDGLQKFWSKPVAQVLKEAGQKARWIAARKRAYEKDPAKVNATKKAWRDRNQEYVKEYERQRWIAIKADPETHAAHRAQQNELRKKNREETNRKKREYWAANKERLNAQMRLRRSK